MVCAVTRCKNEADIIVATVGRMVAQVDHVFVLDGSTDATTDLLRDMPVTLISDDTPTYEQPQQMNWLARKAAAMGADWIVPFDADEVWLANEGSLKARLEALPPQALIADAPLFNHVATALDDDGEPDPVARIGWRRPEPVPLRKVAFRARPDAELHFGQHGVTFHDEPSPLTATGVLQIRHFPYRSHEQFIGKIRVGAPPLMKSTLPESVGAHWRGFGKALEEEGEQSLVDWFDRWAWSDDPESDPELIFDPCLP